ncbi:MAG: response regulator, partial [Thaumarchaeota archaeon]
MISKNRLVAIVDDEADITRLFRDALGVVSGITIFTFTDPIIALEHIMINKTKYVLIISDLRMPGLNGMELIKKVKNMNRLVRTVLMTAFDFDDELFQQYIETQ